MSCTEERFLSDVKDHVIEVIRDDGVHRHVRFRKPGTMCMHFDLITWPGHLCYTGDMGTYVFQRLEDMFQFFRTKDLKSIDHGYWCEKLRAVSVRGNSSGSATEFDPERFKQVINEYRVRWVRERELDKEQRRELWEAVDREVLDYLDEGEHSVYAKANDFSFKPFPEQPGFGSPTYYFQDLWDHRFTDYTYHFTWCCYALAWGIKKYDESKKT